MFAGQLPAAALAKGVDAAYDDITFGHPGTVWSQDAWLLGANQLEHIVVIQLRDVTG